MADAVPSARASEAEREAWAREHGIPPPSSIDRFTLFPLDRSQFPFVGEAPTATEGTLWVAPLPKEKPSRRTVVDVPTLGVGAGGLRDKSSVPPELFPDPRKAKTRRVAETVDRIREKLGPGSVVRARHLRHGELSERGGWEGAGKNKHKKPA